MKINCLTKTKTCEHQYQETVTTRTRLPMKSYDMRFARKNIYDNNNGVVYSWKGVYHYYDMDVTRMIIRCAKGEIDIITKTTNGEECIMFSLPRNIHIASIL